MRGLQLSEEYYRAMGAEMIEKQFPDYKDRIAVGLAGLGSECFGFDDEQSRDHDWGPGFCLWLVADDFEAIGGDLMARYENLPKQISGFERATSPFGGGRLGSFECGAFYRRFIGCSEAPATLEQWLSIPDENLSCCTNGKIFSDPLGRFSEVRQQLLAFYPEDVRRLKIAASCISAAQTGQYNYMRSVRRGADFAVQYSETMFTINLLSLVFLLNKSYAPFYKWMHQAVSGLPVLGGFTHRKISDLLSIRDTRIKAELIEELSSVVIEEFRRQNLSDADGDFLQDHGMSIRDKIEDEWLRSLAIQIR
jgi:hypothetical protein